MRWTVCQAMLPYKMPLAITACLILVPGCGPRPSNETPSRMPEDSLQRSAYLTNGLIGLRFDEFGTGAFRNSALGQRQAMFIADHYESESGEEKILPHPNPITPELRSSQGSCFEGTSGLRQRLDMNRGELVTTWRWGSTAITATTYVHPRKLACYQVWKAQIGSAGDYEARFQIKPVARFRQRIQVKVNGTSLSGTHSVKFGAKAGEEIEITFVVGEDTDLDSGATDHEDFWSEFWTTRITIDGPTEDQDALDSFLFYLRTGTAPNGFYPIGPYGLSSQTYNGHTFWDADLWLFPALALLDPVRARSIPNYRIATASAAQGNFKERRSWYREPPAASDVAKVDALQFPWESSVSGLEVSPTETKQQHHITGSVMWGLKMASDLGLADSSTVNKIGAQAARFYKFRAVPMATTQVRSADSSKSQSLLTILQVVSPDEHQFGDHDLYTNAIADWTMRQFAPKVRTPRYFYPQDDLSYLNYANDPIRGYKQTSGLLAVFPLQDPLVEANALPMIERFADKVSKNGPAMSDSIHATIWARLDRRDKAYEAWKRSWKDFVDPRFHLFSEKRSRVSAYFTTGAAGSLNTVLYGFLGIRIDNKPQAGARWSVHLRNGSWLSIKPRLPRQWRSVTVNGLQILGRTYTLNVVGDSVAVVPQSKKLSRATPIGAAPLK